MAIIEIISAGTLMPLSAMATREDFPVTNEETPVVSAGFEGCPDILKVFADDTGIQYQNDFSSFLVYSLVLDVEMYLQKDCEDVEILGENIGKIYPKGYWSQANGFTFTQSNYAGFVLDWSLVLQQYGVGSYSIRFSYSVGAEEILSLCSCNFLLQQFSPQQADKTMRIRTLQNGHILDSFDYTGMNWLQSWRMDGFFGYPQDKLEVDNYLDKNRNITQIQDTLYKEYTLQTDFIADCFKHIFNDILLSNQIWIDDYNLKNAYQLINIDVLPQNSDSSYYIESTETFKEIIFEDRDRLKVKRNVK